MSLPNNDHLTAQQQMEALTAHLAAIAERNRAACRAVDKAHDYTFAPKSGKRDKTTAREKELARRATIHDYLAENSGLRALYKSGGFEKLLGL